MDNLKMELEQFTGSANYYSTFGGVKYTDGIKYMADKMNAYWLIDIITSYQNKLCRVSFQLWELKVNEDKSAVITCREDTDVPALITQEIEYTDFPINYIKLYCIGNIILLPSEY